MVRLVCAIVATAVLAACPSPSHPTAPDLRLQIAQAEARRGGGVDTLIELATHGAASVPPLALRGLGRVGGKRARLALLAALRGDNAAAAARALGVLASLDELSPAATTEITAALVGALATARGDAQIAMIEALGRAGDATAQPRLVALLGDGDAATRATAAYAFARFGRRKQELDPAARAALVAMVTAAEPATIYAAVYAFARETLPASPPPMPAHQRVGPALAARLDDASPVVRALAAQAIAKQNVVGAAHAQLERALLDADWRVAVEAVRALAGDQGDDAGRDAVAAILPQRFAQLVRGKPAEAQVIIEGLRVLLPHAKRPLVQAALVTLGATVASSQLDAITEGWITCLGAAALARTTEVPDLASIEQCSLPDHLKLPLVAELVGDKVGPIATRRTALAKLLAHADARVRAAAIGALATLWTEASDADRGALLGTFVAAVGAKDPIFAGAALEAAPGLYEAIGTGDHATLDEAIIARAASEQEPELASAALELVGKRVLTRGLDACRSRATAAPVIAAAARSCLRALGSSDAADPGDAEPATLALPSLDLDIAFARGLVWILDTTRGRIEISLAGDSAPWAVASIIALTKRGFYDGLELHRVVPNFVVQGGDPTMSGWGGPGYVLPAEPSADAGFVAGGVGLADGGRDTAGSQWFAMHSPAPHLDARYTWFGNVLAGANVANALLIGDRVTTARFEIRSSKD